MNVTIRQAREDEHHILLEFEKGIVLAERPFDPTLKDGDIHYYDLLELIRSADAEVLIALLNDEVVGSGYGKIVQGEPYQSFENYVHLGFMYVKPEHRGKGINQRILSELIGWAKSKNIHEVRLEVYDENTIAKNAYLKAGFTPSLLKMRIEV